MTKPYTVNGYGFSGAAHEGTWPGIDSRFRLIIVASKRTKQLLSGSKPRIEADKARRRNTSIALEEVKRGLVSFTTTSPTNGSSAFAAGASQNPLEIEAKLRFR